MTDDLAPGMHMAAPMFITRSRRIPACALTLDDLKRLYDDMSGLVREAAEYQVANFRPDPGTSNEQLRELQDLIRYAYKLTARVTKNGGMFFMSNSRQALDAIGPGDFVENIVLECQSLAAAVLKGEPRNNFWLTLDFTRPGTFELRNPVSEPTPNSSELRMSGQNENWLRAVNDLASGFFQHRALRRAWFHRQGVYDAILWLIAGPMIFFLVLRISELYEAHVPGRSTLLDVFATIYAVMIGAWIYRFSFQYTKWVFPLLELRGTRNGAEEHRRNWWILMLSIVASVIVAIFF